MPSIGELLTNPTTWIFIGILLIVLLYSMRHYIMALMSSLFYDYVIDGVFSFADMLLPISYAGVDIGDWIAAALIFLRYRKQVGGFWALIFTFEAANFLLSFIPGIGEGFELFFNLFPIISLVVVYKQHQANTIYEPIHALDSYLKREASDVHKKMQGEIERIKHLYEECAYEEIRKEGRGLEESLFAEVKTIVMKKLQKTQQILITVLQEGIKQGNAVISQQEIDQYKTAVSRVAQDLDTNWQMAADEAERLLQQVSSLGYAAHHPQGPGLFGVATNRKEQQQGATGKQEGIMQKVVSQVEQPLQKSEQPKPPVSQQATQASQKQTASSGIEAKFAAAYSKAGVSKTPKKPSAPKKAA